MRSQFYLKGGRELLDMLDRLPDRLARNIVRGGIRAAAKVIADEAKVQVEKRSGKLAKAIKVSSSAKGTVVSAKVSVRGGKGSHAYAGYFLEYGVEPHWIRPKIRAATSDQKQALSLGPDFVRGAVHHPGFGERPFLRPALDAKAAEAINAMGEYIQARLTWAALQAPALAVEEDEE